MLLLRMTSQIFRSVVDIARGAIGMTRGAIDMTRGVVSSGNGIARVVHAVGMARIVGGTSRLYGVLCPAVVLVVILTLPLPVAFAQHTVNINGSHTGSAYGNSSNGTGDFPDDVPHGNTLKINSGG
ncbi:MAG: hypothetical protein FWD31_06660, partial [Planctomycetaceae bacterium]|nr:hypothetical protein [Planctomycetaceae bacterium]